MQKNTQQAPKPKINAFITKQEPRARLFCGALALFLENRAFECGELETKMAKVESQARIRISATSNATAQKSSGRLKANKS